MEEIRQAPFSIEVSEDSGSGFDVVVVFETSFDQLSAQVETLTESIATNGGLWIAWPKKASKVETDITEDRLRELFLPSTPFVDNKVCAIDGIWSGLRFVRRKAFR